jgi:hypothetical protein
MLTGRKFLSRTRLRFAARRRRDAYSRFFETDAGRTVLADLMDTAGWSKDLFHEDPLITANLLGRRFMILHIKAVLRATDTELDSIATQHDELLEDYPQ